MRRLILGGFLAVLILLLIGCQDDGQLTQKEAQQLHERISELSDTVNEQQQVIERLVKKSPYLNGLTTAERKLYEQFAEDHDVQHLTSFSPEKILLIYFHSLLNHDTDAVLLLMNNNDEWADELAFIEGKYPSDIETAHKYKAYQTVEIQEQDEDHAIVKIGFKAGISNYSALYELKRDNDVWKMER